MHPSILRNTLISSSSIKRLMEMPQTFDIYSPIYELFHLFEDKKRFASEIHTEIHLVKPILKALGFFYESKPAFFEENVKPPDIALFHTEDERLNASQLWGTKEYYDNTTGVVLVKRYGRTLMKGVSGFYLEFENRLPLFQLIYIMKKSKTPWGILTNGRNWILVKKPIDFETMLIEIDIEYPSATPDSIPIHLFCQIFSPEGLLKTIPALLEEEREDIFGMLKKKKESLIKGIKGKEKKADVYPVLYDTYHDIFQDGNLPETESYLKEKDVRLDLKSPLSTDIINPYNTPHIFTYLFSLKGKQSGIDMKFILDNLFGGKGYTKESLLGLKVLDMTPNFGSITSCIIEGFTYISFILPYNEKNTFITEWEDENGLKRHILDTVLYGVERSHVAYDIFQDSMLRRFGFKTRNFKLGNPLIGMSLNDIKNHMEKKDQLELFNKNPMEVITELKDILKQFSSLSDRIKEDVEERVRLEARLTAYIKRIKDVMDAITSTYFIKSVDKKKIQGLLSNLGADELTWDAIRKNTWFKEAKEVAKRNGFFHFEMEFPFLLNDAFDLIFIQPGSTYIWEQDLPVMELTKAYIKRGSSYLKEDGRIVIIASGFEDSLMAEIEGSKKYMAEKKDDLIILSKKQVI
ncbi:MAG TPA: hypothetical protein PKW07_05610 [Syntrophorhabdaceae bacterium]|nr:hypothetical protein [Syntrophorhabdaceae bacterium]